MTVNELKESGLLEQYILGDSSTSEMELVESMLAQHPELRTHLAKLEQGLEQLAKENAIVPPPKVKQQLLKQIDENSSTIEEVTSARGMKSYLAIAATLALLFGISSFYLYQRLNGLENDLRIVEEQKNVLQTEFEDALEEYDDLLGWYEKIKHPNTQKYTLAGNSQAADATLIGYVNHQDKSVFVDTQGLPSLDEDHDYQLWADVDGEMIDMGVINKQSPMLAMTYIDKAESLNITIEPKGGSNHPNVARLIANVYLQP